MQIARHCNWTVLYNLAAFVPKYLHKAMLIDEQIFILVL